MRYPSLSVKVLLMITTIGMMTTINRHAAKADEAYDRPFIAGRIVAVGIPGAGAIAAVGVFLPGELCVRSRYAARICSASVGLLK